MKQTSETSFEPDWLNLREPADHRARDPKLLASAASCVQDGSIVLDLGSGTGSTARAFVQAGFGKMRWRFFDNDATLLRIASDRHPEAECVVGNLGDVKNLPLGDVGLITASALFDLMPESWINALILRAAEADIPIYTALNYDGQMSWTPNDERDCVVTRAFNWHQTNDKGLGPALGPLSGSRFAELSEIVGYTVASAQSPWRLGPQETQLHDAVLDGIAQAAHEAGEKHALDWGIDRRGAVAETLGTIGHTDHLSVPR
ncbi:methyltransferase domain-containing protein [Ruegeria lacuscaerulensis]|uniref:methyltransferase domain-containing protein n=1 Tax=Ruegeria lacuscaerulensis TaxID=55218 RepID=UPI00147E2B6F|nr:class I SAM-dependent methyltransferase [Ruegeria lacuscaerulensis]